MEAQINIPRSIRNIATAACAMAILSTAAVPQASADPTEFRVPEMKLRILTEQCESFGWKKGNHVGSVRFRPAGIGENGNRTYLALHFYYWGERYFRDATSVGPDFEEYNGGGLSTNFFEFANPSKLRLRITTKTPLSPKTKKLVLNAYIRDLDGVLGCNARFKARLKRHRF